MKVYDALKPEAKHVYDNEPAFNDAYFFFSTLEGNDVIGVEMYILIFIANHFLTAKNADETIFLATAAKMIS